MNNCKSWCINKYKLKRIVLAKQVNNVNKIVNQFSTNLREGFSNVRHILYLYSNKGSDLRHSLKQIQQGV